MYVCNCNGIREQDLTQGIQAGLNTIKALRETLGVGTCCGKCVCDVRKHLQDAQAHGHGCRGGCHGSQRTFEVELTPAWC